MTEVNRRNLTSRSDSENLMDSEKRKMVTDIVAITQVSQDQALFALHDSDFNLVLALENVMKGKPDDKVMQKTSRRKKKESEYASTGDKNSDANHKDHKGAGEKTDSSPSNKHQKSGGGNRKQNSSSAKSKDKDQDQQVKPLMEIQTGNWGDTENRLVNGTLGGSHGNRSGDGRRGTGRGRGRGGLSRGGFNGGDRVSNRRSAPAGEDSQYHPPNTRNGAGGITEDDMESSQQSFPQPFVVGTFDAKTMENPDAEQTFPASNESARHFGGGSENRFGGSSRGRGRFSARGGGSNRNSNPRDRNRTGDNSNNPDSSGAAPVPLFDNLWSAEEKWDVKSDGDWRGREFTPTVSNDVIKNADEDITSSSAAVYYCNAQGVVAPAGQSDGPVVAKGPMPNGEVDCALQPTTKVNEQYSSSVFDPRVNANKPEESDNFLLKLLGQQVAMDNQVHNMHLSSKPAEPQDQVSQQDRAANNNNVTNSGSNHAKNQFMNMSMNANNTMNGRSGMPPSGVPTSASALPETPDVPPGFAETLNSENLEFGSPPSTFQTSTSRKQPPTHIPAAPVELPSPVSSFAIGTPVNFGEIDPRYLNRHQYNSINTAESAPVQNSSNNSVEFFTRKFAANPAVSFVNTPESPSRNASTGGKQTQLPPGSQTEALPSVPGVQPSQQVSLEQARTESISSRPSPGKPVQAPGSSSTGQESSRLGGYSVTSSGGIPVASQNQRSTAGTVLSEATPQPPPNVPAASTTSSVINSSTPSNTSTQDMNKFNQRTMSAQQMHSQQTQQQHQQSQQSFLYQLPTTSSSGAAPGKASQILNNVEMQNKEVSPVTNKSQASSVYYSGNSSSGGSSYGKMNSRSSPGDPQQQQRMSGSNSMSAGFSRPANPLSKSNQQQSGDSAQSATGSKLGSVAAGGSSSNNSLNTNVASFINAAAASQQQQLANAMSAMGIASPTSYQMGYMTVDGNERASNQIQQLMNSANSSRYQMQQQQQSSQQAQHQLNASGSNPGASMSQQYHMVTAANPVAVMQNGPSNYGAHFSQSAAANQAVHPSLAAANMVAINNQQQSPSSQMKNSNDSLPPASAAGAPMGHYNMNLSSAAASLQQQSISSTTAAEVSKMMNNNAAVSSNVRRLNSEDNSSSMGAATSANSSHVASTSVQHAQQQNLAQNPAAAPLPFFLATAAHPYHAAATSFPPSNPAAATAFYPQAAVSAFLNNPAAQAMFQTAAFNLPQLQAQLQQQQSPGASVQPASSSATQQTLKSQQMSMGAHNGPSNTSQQAFANSGQMGNSYFQGAQNSDYMSGGASSASDYKYGGAASQQQQMGPQSAAIGGAYGSRSSSGATAGGMATTNASNKTNLYGNSSDYSALYAKGLDKTGGNVGGLNAPGLASTSPPQAANANFSNYMPAAFGAQAAAAAAAAGSPQLYSQQQFLSAAAAQNLIPHDPRASAVGGSLKPVSGLGPASSTLHSKHATGQHSGPVSSFASNNFSWQ